MLNAYNPHLLLSLGRKTSNLLILNNMLASNGAQKASEDSQATAAIILSGTTTTGSEWMENEDSHSEDDAAILPDIGRNFLEVHSMRIANQSSMSCRREEDAIV